LRASVLNNPPVIIAAEILFVDKAETTIFRAVIDPVEMVAVDKDAKVAEPEATICPTERLFVDKAEKVAAPPVICPTEMKLVDKAVNVAAPPVI
jgi:hypothetical protein